MGFRFEECCGGYAVCAYEGCARDVRVPSSHGGRPVVEIADGAFSRADGDGCAFESVFIPASLQRVGSAAFERCRSLEAVCFERGSRLESLGERAFEGCSSLQRFDWDASVERVGRGAFWGCESLAAIALPDGLVEIGAYAFSDCRALADADLPLSLERIGRCAFDRCTGLRRVTLGPGCRLCAIDDMAFRECRELADFDLSQARRLSRIGAGAFFGCDSLRLLSLPPSVRDFAPWCTDCIFATGPSGKPTPIRLFAPGLDWDAVDEPGYRTPIAAGLVFCSARAGGFGLPAGSEDRPGGPVTGHPVMSEDCAGYLRDNSVDLCRFLDYDAASIAWLCERRLVPEDALDSLLSEAARLGRVELAALLLEYRHGLGQRGASLGLDLEDDGGLSSAGSSGRQGRDWVLEPVDGSCLGIAAFIGNRPKIEIPARSEGLPVRSVGAFAFSPFVCSGGRETARRRLESVAVPEGVVEIGPYAFYDCERLESVSLPESLRELGSSAFKRCSRLKSVSLPARLREVPPACFAYCLSLDAIAVPPGCALRREAFTHAKIARLVLPEGVELEGNLFVSGEIGEMVFRGSVPETSLSALPVHSTPRCPNPAIGRVVCSGRATEGERRALRRFAYACGAEFVVG